MSLYIEKKRKNKIFHPFESSSFSFPSKEKAYQACWFHSFFAAQLCVFQHQSFHFVPTVGIRAFSDLSGTVWNLKGESKRKRVSLSVCEK